MKSYSGIVTRRSGHATTLGFPTINIPFEDTEVSGIYAALVRIEGISYPAAAYADPARGMLEAHLLDFDEQLDDELVSISLVHKIRDDARFANEAELKAAIAKDVSRVKYYFLNTHS